MKLVAKTLVMAALLGGAVNLAQAAGDAAAGKAKAAVCGACHGADGNSMVPNFPKLAGQGERYLVKQLHDMKSNVRAVPEMAGITPGLSDQDIEDLAAFFASQKTQVGATDPALVELGAKLFRAGKKEAGVTACAGCHGANGLGMPEAGFPALSGQHSTYVEAQLKAFRAAGREDAEGKRRTNDGEAKMMQATAARLSDNEIKALSSFINGLH
ncbi:MAG TPA: c-type cytochrome [Dongiaceae bacterium]|nr:c-type cytochrome [Dongiaceae bacterium]